jgi:hypothetical protein
MIITKPYDIAQSKKLAVTQFYLYIKRLKNVDFIMPR